MSSVGRVTKTTSVYVVDEAPTTAIEGTAIVEEAEMADVEDRIDLRDLIMDRGEEEGTA
jgi:putative transcriptional regulator